MRIDPPSANHLCQCLLQTLSANSLAVSAALQAGAGEEKLRGWIQQGLTTWLQAIGRIDDLLCITEFKKTADEHAEQPNGRDAVDFVFIDSNSVGQHNLKIDTLFEAKFNYARHRDVVLRPAVAAAQLQRYISAHMVDGYLIYLVGDAIHRTENPRRHHDRGWNYAGTAVPGRLENRVALMRDAASAAGLRVIAGDRVDVPGWTLQVDIFALSHSARVPPRGDIFDAIESKRPNLAIVFGHRGFNLLGASWAHFGAREVSVDATLDPFMLPNPQVYRGQRFWFVLEENGLSDEEVLGALDAALGSAEEQGVRFVVSNGAPPPHVSDPESRARANSSRARMLFDYANRIKIRRNIDLAFVNMSDVFERNLHSADSQAESSSMPLGDFLKSDLLGN